MATKKQNESEGIPRGDKVLLITGQHLFSEKELDKIRWQFSYLGGYCGAYKSHGRGVCMAARNWKTGNSNGRCTFHGGSSKHGPINKRMITMNKLTKLDKRSKLSTEIFNEKEMKLYEDLQEMIRSEYEITDPIAISQVARLLIYQNFLLDKMNQGFNINIEGSSKEIRAWLESYGLTPRSKVAINLDGADPGLLARVIIDVHDKMEAKRLQEQEDNTN
ncbi:MAG: hypothetical protein APG08_00391 [Candidatus Methanofastidiosum methylothiophilum]|uniref:Uncharacterized protein n=1 Tax=Candidatus Methanofastidiosum methylothiophilum TaxID=1705564 RepID=A0A150JDG7_9EURY|nr:MAG: hypothetical protein AN188_00243 [Candidatus Methanofastidiosum methylthiophilus]KYC57110.1 MAG: hypothetical protein APG08_00391 [Candidatus Methanofastidiosum methylthiophilus]OQC52528.1 MAG: hypothetical protein BWX56_00245 [Euryarchaeota archaeon ADurb.Bin023]